MYKHQKLSFVKKRVAQCPYVLVTLVVTGCHGHHTLPDKK